MSICPATSTRFDITYCWTRSRSGSRTRQVLHLVKQIIKAGGKIGVPQGGPFSPLAANIYLNEVDWFFDDDSPQNGGRDPMRQSTITASPMILSSPSAGTTPNGAGPNVPCNVSRNNSHRSVSS